MKIYTPEEWAAMERTKTAQKRTKCTKYQLVTCLKTHFSALLTQLRAEYADNPELQFYWNTVQELDRNNADFKRTVQQLGITDEQLDAIFEKIEGPEPTATEVSNG